ncbi:hypothetical protein DdX_20043 [Ditylenchus destructor]|uniref:Uncharacterized protein n=1 Tax=Ditylenchus destructor TaxID=166010 RepID=A0AAD4MGV6_9BILA|nr:hypothetical protein DdX_20043 [Ditylenchus destructor]
MARRQLCPPASGPRGHLAVHIRIHTASSTQSRSTTLLLTHAGEKPTLSARKWAQRLSNCSGSYPTWLAASLSARKWAQRPTKKNNKSEVERLNQAIKDKGKELGVMEGKILQIKHRLQCIIIINKYAYATDKGGVLYKDAPKYFTWLKDECRWKIRERLFNTLGRIYSVSPSDKTGRLELRILLHYVRSPTSYTDFLVIDKKCCSEEKCSHHEKTYKHVCKTFQESCFERGLIEDDKVYNTIMEEAKEFKMPSAIRNLFALLLLNCEVKEPGRL